MTEKYRTSVLFANNGMIVLFRICRYELAMRDNRVQATDKRSNNPVGVRNRLVVAAARMFQERGVAATSMHDIKRAAEVSSGSLYHHFPTKKGLALAVISERVRAEVAATWIAAVRNADNAATGILTVFDSVITLLDRNGSVSGCPLGNLAVELSLADPEIRRALAQEYGTWRSAIEDRVREDYARGEATFVTEQTIESFSYVVVAMFSGAMAIAKTEQRTFALKACVDQLRLIMGAANVPVG